MEQGTKLLHLLLLVFLPPALLFDEGVTRRFHALLDRYTATEQLEGG